MDEQKTVATCGYSQVMDAIYRFGFGVDCAEMTVLNTVFTDEAIIDFGPCGRKMGMDFPVLVGADKISTFLKQTAETQTTSHLITNGRVTVENNKATLKVLVHATHLPKNDHSRKCQMMNWYEAELRSSENLWRISSLVIDSVWFDGDTNILMGR